jgi:7-cyano-7-deazaguanine synthase in queuosine biosynthesis
MKQTLSKTKDWIKGFTKRLFLPTITIFLMIETNLQLIKDREKQKEDQGICLQLKIKSMSTRPPYTFSPFRNQFLLQASLSSLNRRKLKKIQDFCTSF